MMKPMESSSQFLYSDLEEERHTKVQNEQTAQQVLDIVGNLFHKANDVLADLESDMLGSAIVRKCQELADAVGGLANDLESRTDHERSLLAQACLEDIQQQQQQILMFTERGDQEQLLTLTQEDISFAFIGAQELLRDVEASLRSISQNEADELADVAITLANMFMLGLRNFLDTTTAADVVNATTGTPILSDIDFADQIELLDESDQTGPDFRKHTTNKKNPQVRCLWPPLGPAVSATLQWTHQEATKQPLLAVALGLVLWPAAIVTAVLGTPVVVGDALIQHLYMSFKHTPLISTAEGVTAQALYAGKFMFLSTQLVVKQTLRVASRQVARRGGLGAVIGDVKEMVVDQALHPVKTAQQIWNGILYSVGMAQDVVGHIQAAMAKEQDKVCTQTLQ